MALHVFEFSHVYAHSITTTTSTMKSMYGEYSRGSDPDFTQGAMLQS